MRLSLTAKAVLLGLLLVAAPASARQRPLRRAIGMSEVRHVFIVVLENEDSARADAQPFLAELAKRGATLSNFHGITHPSQPNYFAMVAGNTFGVADEAVSIDARHLGDLLEARGLTWKVYAESYPGNCYTGSKFGDTVTGTYVRRHNPFISFVNVWSRPERCAMIANAAELDSDVAASRLPSFSFYVPNTNNDGHDPGVAFADAFMRARFGPLLDDPRFSSGTLFIVVFDESRTTSPSNLVYCVFVGAGVKAGGSSASFYDHYSLLRTIEEIFHLGTLGTHDAAAAPISDIWRTR